MPECQHCFKPLKAIGRQRKNGKSFRNNDSEDWKSRQYHKKCYKAIFKLQLN
jgi:hypothetical protein